MNLTTTILSVCCVVYCCMAVPLHSHPGGSVPTKLDHANIRSVYKNSSTQFKFMFPNIPADELDNNNYGQPSFTRLDLKQKHAGSNGKLPVGNAAVAAGVFSEVADQLQGQEVFKSFHDEEIRITEPKYNFERSSISVKLKVSPSAMQNALLESTISRTQDIMTAPLQNSLGHVATDDQLPIYLSPEEMAEISETGRLCSEDGECIYFTDDWGNNCCPFG